MCRRFPRYPQTGGRSMLQIFERSVLLTNRICSTAFQNTTQIVSLMMGKNKVRVKHGESFHYSTSG